MYLPRCRRVFPQIFSLQDSNFLGLPQVVLLYPLKVLKVGSAFFICFSEADFNAMDVPVFVQGFLASDKGQLVSSQL